jgi:hypothetical protein
VRTLLLLVVCVCLGHAGEVSAAEDLRFEAVDIYLDSNEPVAAWQFELSDRNGRMKVVGVENGESTAYQRAPYYDREAVRLDEADRIVVADYSLAGVDELPSGRTRIATIHLMLDSTDDKDIELTLITATTRNGRIIDASLSFVLRTGSEL